MPLNKKLWKNGEYNQTVNEEVPAAEESEDETIA